MDAELEHSLLTQAAHAGRADSMAGIVPEVEGYSTTEVFSAAAQLYTKEFLDAAVGRTGQQTAPESVRLVGITALGRWRLDDLQRPVGGPDGTPR